MKKTMTKPAVAILGLGIMGSGMARRLLSANFPVTVYNRSREKSAPFVSAGAFAAATPTYAIGESAQNTGIKVLIEYYEDNSIEVLG